MKKEYKKRYYVDIPNADNSNWTFIAEFDNKKNAIAFAQNRFGADKEGKINLITEHNEEADS